MANINIYGVLHNATAEGIIAKAAQIKDDKLNKLQSEINAMVMGGEGGGEASLPEQIADVLKKLNEHIATKNQPNGFAGLDENGKIPASLIDGVNASILGLEQFVDANPQPVVNGVFYYNTTSKKILEGKGGVWVETDPRSQVIYNRRGEDEEGYKNTLYRWDGSTMVDASDRLVIGATQGTAYDGAEGSKNRAWIESLPAELLSVAELSHTKNDITVNLKKAVKGADNYAAIVDNKLYLEAATSEQAGLMTGLDRANLNAIVEAMGGDPLGSDPLTPDTADFLKKSDAGVGVLKDYAEAGAKEKVAANDTINVAVGKLQKQISEVESGASSPVIPEIPVVEVPQLPEAGIGQDIPAEITPNNGEDLKTIIGKLVAQNKFLLEQLKQVAALVQVDGYQLVYVDKA